MKSRIVTAFLIASAITRPAPADELLAKVTLEQLETAPMPEGVTIETKMMEGVPGATIRNTQAGAVSVQLVEVPLGIAKAMRYSYEAEVASDSLAGQAYLEMWMVVKGQAYFSRALNDTFSGSQTARMTATPFFLKADEPAEAARLGIRFEGPGTITIREMELWDRGTPNTFGLPPGMLGGIAGSAIGIFSGVWGGLAAYLIGRGRARGFVLGVTAAGAVAGAIMLSAGVAAWMLGARWEIYYSAMLMGVIVTPVYGAMYASFYARYRQAEQRRMLAMDLQ